MKKFQRIEELLTLFRYGFVSESELAKALALHTSRVLGTVAT